MVVSRFPQLYKAGVTWGPLKKGWEHLLFDTSDLESLGGPKVNWFDLGALEEPCGLGKEQSFLSLYAPSAKNEAMSTGTMGAKVNIGGW